MIEITPEFEKALALMESDAPLVFVTGKAGTGKSTLLEHFRANTHRNIAVLAPTGVAALNVGGETIHSFFKFRSGLTPTAMKRVKDREVYEHLDALVIDEVSMLRCDLLDLIDAFLRKNGPKRDRPFGGVRMIFVGDLFQLPPVVTREEEQFFSSYYPSPYFFDAYSIRTLPMAYAELSTVYRQQDASFIELLNSIRENQMSEYEYERLSQRVVRGVMPELSRYQVHLTTTNSMADRINMAHLNRLGGETWKFSAAIEGDVHEKYFPNAKDLFLKPRAQVMLLNNDFSGRWVNGSLAEVVGVEYDHDAECDVVGVELEDGRLETVKPHRWEIFKYRFDEEAQGIHADPVGMFAQYPMKLAWAVTIHKAQGKTFDRCVIDLGYGTFAHGQAYVALSRCRTLEGITLRRAPTSRDIHMDERILTYLQRLAAAAQ
jgi:ATP-dependent exoDNAse (exonuclease V) alpha subunit